MDAEIMRLARSIVTGDPGRWTSTTFLLARAIMEDQKSASALKRSSGISCYFCHLPAVTMAAGFAVCEPHRDNPMADTEDIAEPETLADKVLGRNPTSYHFASPEDLAPRPDVLRTSTCKHCEQPVELIDVSGGTLIWNHYTPSRGRWAPCSEELWAIAHRMNDPSGVRFAYLARGGTAATPQDDEAAEPPSPPPEPLTPVSGHYDADALARAIFNVTLASARDSYGPKVVSDLAAAIRAAER